jgi:hypothetical protein
MLPGELAGSKSLASVNSNLWRLATNVLQHVALYCATPSATDEVLITNISNMPRQAVAEALVSNGFKAFRNFAATDAQLAREMLHELSLRSIDLKRTNDHHLVLISEWDTFYARMLSLTYAAEMAVTQGAATSRADFIYSYISNTNGAKRLPANLHSFVYLRGLDGQTVGGNASAKTSSPNRSPTASFEELRKWAPDANKAEGPAQFDNLGRLGDQLKALEDRLRRQNGRIRVAVGIVGSDVYDILLILQALRDRFEHVLFFTTDLDARFWHPRERKWSRNLVVSSSYGLMLHPDLQGGVAPFRDSTQTAQFAAALAALGNEQVASLTNIPPRRFEIGNQGPVDLSVEPRLPSSHLLTDVSNGPWLHPLTAAQTCRLSTPAMSWPRALALLPWPLKRETKLSATNGRSSQELQPPCPEAANRWTKHDVVVRSSYALGCALALACIFWQPLRARTFGILALPIDALSYRKCDVGEADDVASLRQWSADIGQSNGAQRILAEEWPKYELKNLPLASNSSSPPANPAANLAPPATENASFESVNAAAFVQFLNCLLRDMGSKTLPGRTVSAWNPRRILRRWENRRQIDAALDERSEPHPDESQLSSACSVRLAARKLFRIHLCNLLGFWFVAGMVIALAWWIGHDILEGAGTAGAEPFSLTNGISGWPAILLRLLAVLLSLVFCVTLWSRMRTMFYELTRYYRFPLQRESRFENARRRVKTLWSDFERNRASTSIKGTREVVVNFGKDWIRGHLWPFADEEPSQSGCVCASRLWQRYRDAGHWAARTLRAAAPCFIYFLLAGIIYQAFGVPFSPLRGDTGDPLFEWARFKMPQGANWPPPYAVVNLSFFFLTFLTIDAALLCRRFINKLSGGNVVFPGTTRAHFRRQRGDVSGEWLDDWIGTHLIADLTERVGKLLWFPSIILLLLLMARLGWWDHWPWHTAHTLITILNLSLALASIVILQRAARDAKRAAEKRMLAKVKRLQAQTSASVAKNDASQAETLLREIREINHGAFASVWDNPVLGAVLVGPGGFTLLQMVIWWLSR